ncbi:YibE/F family protein [Gleimia hominis]|uniref:YibE/F family protein n=1 Tax=Gleimia hominis TaxID=595468 RepID=UPI001E5358A8|nr:YibE/F family protein [Gleimia hominis]WIK64406.1 YibE/F family protein [Gleimia hominis]
MSHAHHNHGPLELPRKRLLRIRLTLAAIVLPLAIATVVGLVLLWPSGKTPVGSVDAVHKDATAGAATITDLRPETCAEVGGTYGGEGGASGGTGGTSEEEGTSQVEGTSGGDGPGAANAVCARIDRGLNVGQTVVVQVPPEVYQSLKKGTHLKILQNKLPAQSSVGTPEPTAETEPNQEGASGVDATQPQNPDATQPQNPEVITYYWDIERGTSMATLIAIYVVLVLIVARVRGAAAICGLAASVLVLLYFVMPALMSGEHALAVTLTGISAMMFSSVYLAHGISIRTTTALLGTFGGVVLSVVIAVWQVGANHLSGASNEDAQLIFGFIPAISLQWLLICGIVIAGLGALNDVTITQASAVWELHEANPRMGRARLFARAMRIGRDHIASTVYTLAFAYAGTALPALLLALMVRRSGWDLVTSASIAEEIVRTLIASIGLIAAIPLTTAVGTLLVSITKPPVAEPQVR